MGTRVEFCLGPPDGLDELLESRLSELEGLVRADHMEWPQDGWGEALDALVALQRLEHPMRVTNRAQARWLDLAMDELAGRSEFLELGAWLTPVGEWSFNVRNYSDALPELVSRAGDDAGALWLHLVSGRGVGHGRAPFRYVSSDDVFRVGWWTNRESRTLLAHLESAFPRCIRRVRRGRSRRTTAPHALAVETVAEAIFFALERSAGLVAVVA